MLHQTGNNTRTAYRLTDRAWHIIAVASFAGPLWLAALWIGSGR